MLMKKLVLPVTLSFAFLGIASCTTTPSQDEDFVIYGEEPEGPGVISDETGEIKFSLGKTTDQDTADEAEISAGISASEAEEFEAFKRWLKARQSQDESYQEFQQWLKYEEYQQWKKSL